MVSTDRILGVRVPLLALPLTLALLLSGCSDAPDPVDDASDPMTSSTDGGSEAVGLTIPPPAPVELANTTLDFASPTGGSAGSADVLVPATHGNVSIAFLVLGDCPGGYAAEEPRLIAVDAAGTEHQLWAYTSLAPHEVYNCSFASQLTEAEWANATIVLPALPGTWTLKTLGQFTAHAQIVVTALA